MGDGNNWKVMTLTNSCNQNIERTTKKNIRHGIMFSYRQIYHTIKLEFDMNSGEYCNSV